MSKGIVRSFFDLSGNMVKPWADAGYTCYCYDIKHPVGLHWINGIGYMGIDLLNCIDSFHLEYGAEAIAFYFPPCTDTAVSGARWFKGKGLSSLINALQLFNFAVKRSVISGAPFMIENPVSTVSTYYRTPDFYFQPWQYGDLYNKKTCLWTGKGFKMPKPLNNEKPQGVTDKIHRNLRSAEKRSITPIGFAVAVYESNKG